MHKFCILAKHFLFKYVLLRLHPYSTFLFHLSGSKCYSSWLRCSPELKFTPWRRLFWELLTWKHTMASNIIVSITITFDYFYFYINAGLVWVVLSSRDQHKIIYLIAAFTGLYVLSVKSLCLSCITWTWIVTPLKLQWTFTGVKAAFSRKIDNKVNNV